MLTRVYHAQDWETGFELSSNLLGRLSSLQMHHIFPRALLYKHGYKMDEVNSLANFTFLTQETNLIVSDKDPAEYLERYAQLHPGAIESHWIPTDRRLWRIENYLEFLAARRELLARAANQFLDGLLSGRSEQAVSAPAVMTTTRQHIPSNVALEDEEQAIIDTAEWIHQHGLPTGEMLYELADPDTSEPLAIFDLAWPEGLQEGLSQPVALLLNESEAMERLANDAGFRYFTSVATFRDYVQREILAEHMENVAD
ncbi:MAG: hypothetical protein M9890_12150 [Thermomicrobiales bacterium]|nr:hypothetical protein [Thermomicrobiales bacterium]